MDLLPQADSTVRREWPIRARIQRLLGWRDNWTEVTCGVFRLREAPLTSQPARLTGYSIVRALKGYGVGTKVVFAGLA